jgi:hypothetical protein
MKTTKKALKLTKEQKEYLFKRLVEDGYLVITGLGRVKVYTTKEATHFDPVTKIFSKMTKNYVSLKPSLSLKRALSINK